MLIKINQAQKYIHYNHIKFNEIQSSSVVLENKIWLHRSSNGEVSIR